LSIETAAYISDLNASNPPDADPVGQADDHIRLIKGVLKATFPNITGPVTSTQSQLNAAIPAGIITYWYGSTGSVPTGWALCAGGTFSRSDGGGTIVAPDLRDIFIRAAAGGSVAAGATGGAATHGHTVTVAGHALTTAELPVHNHPVSDPGHNHGISDPGHSHTFTDDYSSTTTVFQASSGGVPTSLAVVQTNAADTTSGATTGIGINNSTTGISVANTGSGIAHGHTGSVDTQSNLPPFVGLVVIMKI
jgi:hypothetical protein